VVTREEIAASVAAPDMPSRHRKISRRLRVFFAQHPTCCFCGGSRATEEIEHQPSRIVFPDKKRPKGMEFPTCKRCNEQTRDDEPLLAVLSRILASERFVSPPDNGYHKALRSLYLRRPKLLLDMNQGRRWTNQNGIIVRKGALNVNLPAIDLSLCRIAAKLLLGLHYEILRVPIKEGAIINTFWTHNQKSFSDVSNLLGMLPKSKGLKQGKWDSEDTFL
jgi:hypothetical protein